MGHWSKHQYFEQTFYRLTLTLELIMNELVVCYKSDTYSSSERRLTNTFPGLPGVRDCLLEKRERVRLGDMRSKATSELDVYFPKGSDSGEGMHGT